ncbi:MAG: 16S rRNA (cytosine(1402)-N(4))-methyltransferase RsmH [Clostridia bacterium]|nr:16S rRNA (cytosine(1402)-N(4))-methyltransferase RsmH [Clostridia bacterium]
MDLPSFSHVSVLLGECIDSLNIRDGYTYVDCTTGGAGHSYEIARRMGKGSRLFCFDRDADALLVAKERLAPFAEQVTFIHENFSELGRVLDEYRIDNLGGVLMDLGCSSYQFDTPERGFSYRADAPLDMRMDRDALFDAYAVVNTYSEQELKRILFEYGEERFAPRIASGIVRAREKAPIRTTDELVSIIRAAMPSKAKNEAQHPARRTFQAIRIEVNGELQAIEPAIKAAARRMTVGGRLAIISFHSLEDRIVKRAYADLASGCECPKDFPVCICGKRPTVDILTRKPILPTEEELSVNPRSRSAKLRVAERLQS